MSSADNLCKQFDTVIVFQKEFLKKFILKKAAEMTT